MILLSVILWGAGALLCASGAAFPGVDAIATAAFSGGLLAGASAAARRGPLPDRRAGLYAATLSLAGLGLMAWLRLEASP